MSSNGTEENESNLLSTKTSFEGMSLTQTENINNQEITENLSETSNSVKYEKINESSDDIKENNSSEEEERDEQEEEVNLFTDIDKLKNVNREVKIRRKEIPPRANHPLHLWSIIKNCIGKDLSKLPLPVNFSEPISFLQRLTEELEYSNLLDIAAKCSDQWEQLAYIVAFTISSYSTTSIRINKPFDPFLGETFECDRLDDMGWRSLSEQGNNILIKILYMMIILCLCYF